MNPDADVVTAQLGRPPRGTWAVAARCRFGAPVVITVAPRLDDGSPFPTALWLTCPHAVEAVHAMESAGEAARWSERVRRDPDTAARVAAADAAYRARRAALSQGDDPCASTGVAGQADPLAVKCLHARLAAALAGIDDPVGCGVLDALDAGPGRACADGRCVSDVGAVG